MMSNIAGCLIVVLFMNTHNMPYEKYTPFYSMEWNDTTCSAYYRIPKEDLKNNFYAYISLEGVSRYIESLNNVQVFVLHKPNPFIEQWVEDEYNTGRRNIYFKYAKYGKYDLTKPPQITTIDEITRIRITNPRQDLDLLIKVDYTTSFNGQSFQTEWIPLLMIRR